MHVTRQLTRRPVVPLGVAFFVLALPAGIGAQELTEFQVKHADLVEKTVEEAEGREPGILEIPEPSAKFDKGEFRRLRGDNTRDTGRAWKPDPDRMVAEGPSSFSVDLAVEAIDLDAASSIFGFFYTPPDTMGAVGPTQFVTTLNGVYRFHDKTTGAPDTSLDVAADTFWVTAVDPNDDGGGDPRVRFDRLTDTWIIIAFELAGGSLANNRLLIAQSDGPTISTSTVWTQWYIIPKDTVDGGSNNNCFADYPMLGVDVNAIYLGANMFGISAPCPSVETAVFVLPKSQLPGSGGNASSVTTAFTGLLTSGPIWSPMPADNYDPAASTGYVIGHDATSDTTLLLGKITNPGGAPGTPSLSFTSITISNKNDGWSSGAHNRGVAYPGVPSPSAGTPSPSDDTWGLDPLGFRPLGGAHVRDGRLWTAMTSSVNGPSGNLVLWPTVGDRNSVVFFEIDVSTNTLIQDGNVFDGVTAQDSNPIHLFMGSVGVNGQGHAVVGATGNNTTAIAPSGYWAERMAGDPLGTFSEPASFYAGTDTGDLRQSFEVNSLGQPDRITRWGDYSMVTVDPCDDMTFYTIQEYQDSPSVATGGNWGTAVARILAPAPTFGSASPSSIPAGSASTMVTVTGTGFYSPPTMGMSSCRTDLDATTTFSGLAINGVTFVSPTEIEIDFDSTAASDGTATVDVVNPDGQSVGFSLGISGVCLASVTVNMPITGSEIFQATEITVTGAADVSATGVLQLTGHDVGFENGFTIAGDGQMTVTAGCAP